MSDFDRLRLAPALAGDPGLEVGEKSLALPVRQKGPLRNRQIDEFIEKHQQITGRYADVVDVRPADVEKAVGGAYFKSVGADFQFCLMGD